MKSFGVYYWNAMLWMCGALIRIYFISKMYIEHLAVCPGPPLQLVQDGPLGLPAFVKIVLRSATRCHLLCQCNLVNKFIYNSYHGKEITSTHAWYKFDIQKPSDILLDLWNTCAHMTERIPDEVVRLLTAKSHEVAKPQDWMLWWFYHYEIWQASQQQCCWDACQISEWLEKSKPETRTFETSGDLAVRCSAA